MSDKPPKVSTDIDFDLPGKQVGHLIAPHSHDASAWGSLRVPFVLVNGTAGTGSTIMFVGGNHGDEYEGPIALLDLARNLDPADVSGRVMIIPALNLPAVQNASRTSPLDGGNMNRVFPGKRDGNLTEMIADYLSRVLIPMCDAVIDIHSGGKTLDFLPAAVIHNLPDTDLMARAKAAMLAFGAPAGLIIEELDAAGMLDTTVEDMGKVFVSTELGGGGTARPENVALARQGVQNMLKHFGLVAGKPDKAKIATRLFHTPEAACFTSAREGGLFEAFLHVGDVVAPGQEIGQIHFYERPERPPEVYTADVAGVLISRHFPGLAHSGDCLAVIARNIAD
jgi:N-alpha-acetyl-L-2,4-diaminobutyrate deacetylase